MRVCETCAFYAATDCGDFGECRFRAPPLIRPLDSQSVETAELAWAWPQTYCYDWCGEWMSVESMWGDDIPGEDSQ